MRTTSPSPFSRRTWLLLALLLAALGLFVSLGFWQVERLAWKRDLIARVDARAHAAPVLPPSPARWGAEADPDARYAYTRVALSGHFLHDKEIPVYASTTMGPGYWIMTPLQTPDGVVWINRGYVPNPLRPPEARPAAPSGQVRVEGLLRPGETAGLFSRANAPAEERWYVRDLVAMDAARGLPASAPYFIDAGHDAAGPDWPRGGLTVVQFRDNHLSYALTWFGMALLTLVALGFVARTERRRTAAR